MTPEDHARHLREAQRLLNAAEGGQAPEARHERAQRALREARWLVLLAVLVNLAQCAMWLADKREHQIPSDHPSRLLEGL
jgi:hypothetical protein